ncbi:15818_t:CDS:2, partial [Racocetra persica]
MNMNNYTNLNSPNNSSYCSVNLFNTPASSNTDKCELEKDRISLEKKKDGTKSEGWAAIIIVGQNYDTKEDILNVAQKNAKNLGFAVSTKNKQKRKKMSKCYEYLYLIKAIPNDSKWCVVEIKNKHNYLMVKDVRVFHEHCQLTQEVRHITVKMLKAGTKPGMIYEAVRSEDGTPTITKKDISNLNIWINFLEETALMAALITGMEERGALGKVFSKSEHLLCTWHIMNNFKKKLKKYFSNVLFDEVMKTIDKFIHLRDCEALNAVITTYKKLASSSSNKSEVLKYLDRHILLTLGPVLLSIISTRWLLFSDKDRLDSDIQMQNEQQKSALLEKLNKILAVSAANLSEVKVPEKIVEKGRPSGTKQLPIALKVPLSSQILANDIDQIYDPKSNSNCEFRSLAFAIKGNEKNWIFVKLAMNSQLTKCMEVYKNWLGYNTNLLSQILGYRALPCLPSFWFLFLDCAQLAADIFSVSITIFDKLNGQ